MYDSHIIDLENNIEGCLWVVTEDGLIQSKGFPLEYRKKTQIASSKMQFGFYL